jgi:E3 ubiquitin-protein ligase UBR4
MLGKGRGVLSLLGATLFFQWWSNLQHAGRVETSRCRLLAHDMKLLLLRFALEESFSTYSKGGGRESNIKLLPYLTLMGTPCG